MAGLGTHKKGQAGVTVQLGLSGLEIWHFEALNIERVGLALHLEFRE